MGVALFERHASGVRLTAAGEVFADHVRRTVTDAENSSVEVQALTKGDGGHVSIATAESAATDFLPAMLANLQEISPGLRFTLTVGTPASILSALLEHHADVILTHEMPRHPEVTVLAAAKANLCAVMREDHPLSGAKALTLMACKGFPIVLATPDLAVRQTVDAILLEVPVRLRPVLVSNNFEATKHYVRLTNAISLQFHLSAEISPGLRLKAVPVNEPALADQTLSLAVRRARTMPARVRTVCEHAARHLRGILFVP